MLIYEDFAIRHKGMVDSSEGREIFGFLTKTENVNIMVAFNDLNMPALSGVARRPEQTFKDNKESVILRNFARQNRAIYYTNIAVNDSTLREVAKKSRCKLL